MCVGMFWPSVGSLRSKYIPESVRSTVMNYFRMPTNLFVLIVLGKVKNLPLNVIFGICVFLNLCSMAAQYYLASNIPQNQVGEIKEETNEC
jgi:hypothetical protein